MENWEVIKIVLKQNVIHSKKYDTQPDILQMDDPSLGVDNGLSKFIDDYKIVDDTMEFVIHREQLEREKQLYLVKDISLTGVNVLRSECIYAILGIEQVELTNGDPEGGLVFIKPKNIKWKDSSDNIIHDEEFDIKVYWR